MEEGDSLKMGTSSKNTPLFKEMSRIQCIHMCFFWHRNLFSPQVLAVMLILISHLSLCKISKPFSPPEQTRHLVPAFPAVAGWELKSKSISSGGGGDAFGNDKTTSKARAARAAGKCGSDELLIDCTGVLLGEMAGNIYLWKHYSEEAEKTAGASADTRDQCRAWVGWGY